MKNNFLCFGFILVNFFNANAQNWTWVKGSNATAQNGIYGTKGVTAITNTPGSRSLHHSCTINNTIYVFGGKAYDNLGTYGDMNDLWKFDPITNNWTWIKGSNAVTGTAIYGTVGIENANNTPGARYGQATWSFNNKMYIMGGYGYDAVGGYGLLNDVWSFNPVTNNWTFLRGSTTINPIGIYGQVQGVEAPNIAPGGRISGVTWVVNNLLYQMGGNGFDANGNRLDLNDLWQYNPATNNWTWLKGSNVGNQPSVYNSQIVQPQFVMPGSRTYAVGWTANNKLYYMGGIGLDAVLSGYLNDLWQYDLVSNNWTWIKGSNIRDQQGVYGSIGLPAINNTPGGRYGAVAIENNGKFFLLGGTGKDGNNTFGRMNDLWRFDPMTNNWTWINGASAGNQVGNYGIKGVESSSNIPGGRYSGTINYVSNANLYIYGGLGQDATGTFGYLNDVWKYSCLNMYTINAGNWNDPNTWSCGKVPAYTDPVTIGHILSVAGTGFCKNITYTLGGKVDILSGGNLKISTP